MRRTADAIPPGAGAVPPHGLASAHWVVAMGAAEGLGAVALCAPGSRCRAIRRADAMAFRK